MKKFETLFNKGVAKCDEGNFEEAVKLFTESLAETPKDFSPHITYFNRGVAKASSGKHKDAIRDFDKAITMEPRYDDALRNRAITKDEIGDYKGANDDYQQAIALNCDKHADCVARSLELTEMLFDKPQKSKRFIR